MLYLRDFEFWSNINLLYVYINFNEIGGNGNGLFDMNSALKRNTSYLQKKLQKISINKWDYIDKNWIKSSGIES